MEWPILEDIATPSPFWPAWPFDSYRWHGTAQLSQFIASIFSAPPLQGGGPPPQGGRRAAARRRWGLRGGAKTEVQSKEKARKYPVRGVLNPCADCYTIAICQAVSAAAGETSFFYLGSDPLAEALALKIREIRCSGSSEPVAVFNPSVIRSILEIAICDDVVTEHQSAAEFFYQGRGNMQGQRGDGPSRLSAPQWDECKRTCFSYVS